MPAGVRQVLGWAWDRNNRNLAGAGAYFWSGPDQNGDLLGGKTLFLKEGKKKKKRGKPLIPMVVVCPVILCYFPPAGDRSNPQVLGS